MSNKHERFNERLVHAMNGMSARSLAIKSGLSPAVVNKYINGDSTPNLDRLLVLTETLGVTVEWLATGLGPRTYNQSSDASLAEHSGDVKAQNKITNTYTSNHNIIDANMSETVINSMIEHGLLKEEWRTGIDYFISIYNKTSGASNSKHVIVKTILNFQIKFYETQLHNLDMNGDGDVFKDYKAHLNSLIVNAKDKLKKLNE